MSSPFLKSSALALLLALAAQFSGAVADDGKTLRVCSDPNNMPFSNQREEGFENALARLLADAMGRELEYTWYPQRRGFARNTLKAGKCDLIMGVPAGYERAEATAPYYRSSYVFVTRREDELHLTGLDDPRLRELLIGVPVVGDDYSNTPGATAMSRRGIIDNLVGYSIFGDYRQPSPPSRIIEAVARGDIDVAIVWGPLAGYFAGRQAVPLEVTPVSPETDHGMPLTFQIAMAVRHGDEPLRRRVEAILRERSPEVRALLERYRVPLLDMTAVATTREES